MHVVLTYRATGALTLRVPALTGMDPVAVAEAAYVASHTPPTTQYGQPGAADIAAAYFARPSGSRLSPLTVGDLVHAAGAVLELVAERDGPPDAWGRMSPQFQVVEDHRPRQMTVSATMPPPDTVAYVEDSRDRLWTGRGAGTWRCLTDAPRRTVPQTWRTVWELHGPLVPLLPTGSDVGGAEPREWADPTARDAHAGIGVAAPSS